MNRYSLTHLSDQTLLHDLVAALAHERSATAIVLAHNAEVDARRLHAPAGYPSMYLYCVQELNLSEDAAFKRIQAARVARRFPVIFGALAEGRVHLSAVGLLAPHLTEDTADELLAAASHKGKAEIEQLLAERFPRPDLPTLVRALPPASGTPAAEPCASGSVEPGTMDLAPGQTNRQLAPGQVGEYPRVTPLAPRRFALQVTLDQTAHDDLEYARALLSHQLPSGDVAAVLGLALKALIRDLEKRKFAATDKPRKSASCCEPGSRHIPAQVRRAVWKRYGGQCTFVSASGHRCAARKFLEFDHVDPVAQGGRASVSGIRLRCRAHNQLEAERAFGAGFMENKRRAAETCAAVRAKAEAAARAKAAAAEVVPWLRKLGFHAGEARQAAASCVDIAGAPLEERVRRALSFTGPAVRSTPARSLARRERFLPPLLPPSG